tara:strand:- start:975 stop:1997 length:1023 start_codon:yes stop_codon:yes gene_type:complete
MNYKVMQRPMFKLGGKAASQGTGITSGLDEKVNMSDGRANYSDGPMTSQDFLRRAMEKIDKREQAIAGMDDMINLQALGGFSRLAGDITTNNPVEAALQLFRGAPSVALPALSAKKKLELQQLDPKTDLALAKALKPTGVAGQKVYEMKLKNLAALEEKEAKAKADFKEGIINQEQYNDEMQFINRRLKMITSGIMTDNDYKQMAIEDLIAEYGSAGVNPEMVKQKTQELKNIFETAYADGGRVDRAMGTPMMGEQPMGQDMGLAQTTKQDVAMETEGQGNNVYAMLRARLPQEISDEVVKLIAYNKEAFADFASIKNQEDVSSFNEKYGVQLVIDVATV